MTRGRGNTTRASKTSIRVESNRIGECASTQRNVIGETPTSSQNNTIGEGEGNNNSRQWTFVFLPHSGLEPSNICSTRICESFKSELDPNGINWTSISQEIKDFYLGEFEKEFYWDPSIDSEVKILWHKKAGRRNRCGGQNAVAKATHTGGSITIGEHRKRLCLCIMFAIPQFKTRKCFLLNTSMRKD
ncbi:hypothetical protein KY289_030344 [Solanum tuberosum]|nr:hypothetical protein KY289_030344 [Solanum tuberosum]